MVLVVAQATIEGAGFTHARRDGASSGGEPFQVDVEILGQFDDARELGQGEAGEPLAGGFPRYRVAGGQGTCPS